MTDSETSSSAAARRRFDIAVIAFGQGFQQVLTLGTGIAVARLLGAANYGLLNLLRNFFGTIATLAPLGLDLQLLKFSGQHAASPEYLAATVDRLRLVAFSINLGLALLIGLCLSNPIARYIYPYPGFSTLLLVTMLGLPLATDVTILGAYYKGADRPGAFALMTIYLQPVARVVMIFLVACVGASTLAVACINTVQIAISALALLIDLRKYRRRTIVVRAAPASWAVIRPLLATSLWMAASLFIYGLMRVLDILLLGHFATAKDVGEYGALSTIAQIVQVYPLAASQTLGPNISRCFHAGDQPGMKAALDGYLYMASLVASFFFAGIAGFGDRLDLVFGHSFAFHADVAFLLPLGYLLSATLAPMGYALSMTGRHRSETGILCIGAGSLVLLCCLLIPRFGQIGAAMASAASFAVINLLRYAYVAHRLHFIPGRPRDLLAPLVALGCAFASRALIGEVAPRNLVATFAGCVLYTTAFALAVSFALLHRRDRATLLQGVGRRLFGSPSPTQPRIVVLAPHFAEYAMRLAVAYGERTPTMLVIDERGRREECDPHLVQHARGKVALVEYRSASRLQRRLSAVLVPLRIIAFRPDIVHIQEQGDDLTTTVVRIIRPFVRLALTVHDPVPHTGNDAAYASRKADNLALLRASAALYHVHGQACEAALVGVVGSGKPIVSTHHGALFIPHPAAVPTQPEPGRVLLFGRMEAYKGVDETLRATVILARRAVPFHLVLAGQGPELQRLHDRILENPHVTVEPRFLSPAEVRVELARAAVVLVPYRDATQSGVIAAAFGSGRPVIATRVGGLVDAVRDGIDGLLIAPGNPDELADAIQAVLTDEDLAERLAAGVGESRSTHFAWSTIAATLVTHFTELVAAS